MRASDRRAAEARRRATRTRRTTTTTRKERVSEVEEVCLLSPTSLHPRHERALQVSMARPRRGRPHQGEKEERRRHPLNHAARPTRAVRSYRMMIRRPKTTLPLSTAQGPCVRRNQSAHRRRKRRANGTRRKAFGDDARLFQAAPRRPHGRRHAGSCAVDLAALPLSTIQRCLRSASYGSKRDMVGKAAADCGPVPPQR